MLFRSTRWKYPRYVGQALDFKLFFDIDTHSATRLVRSVEPVDIKARNLNFVVEHIFVQPGFGKSENISVWVL